MNLELNRTERLAWVAGASLLAVAVMLGAFGAHALKGILTEERMAVYQTAVQYQFFHALGLLVLGSISSRLSEALWLHRIAWLLIIGIGLFSGSLYLLVLTDTPRLGMITPFGGLCLVAAWILLAWTLWRQR